MIHFRLCQDKDLSYERMVEISTLQRDLLEGLVALGFLKNINDGLNYSNTCNKNLKIPKIVTAVICAGLYPQISKIVRPAQRFTDTQGGKIEKNVRAQELEFFIYDNSKEIDRLLGDTAFDCSIDNDGMTNNSNNNNSNYSNNNKNNNSKNYNNNNSNNNNNNNTSNNYSNNNNNNNNNSNNNSSIDQDSPGYELIKVSIHNSSLNTKNVTFKSSNYMVYSEKKLSATYGVARDNLTAFLHDISEVSPFPLLFFCGEIEAQYTESTVTVDKWIKFSAPGKIVILILSLRKAFDQLLTEKIMNPEFGIYESKVLEVVCELLATDGLSA